MNEITCLEGPASQSGPMPLALPAPLGTVKPYRSSWVVPQYDAAGNMTTMPQPADPYKSFNAVWDGWNRMVALLSSGQSVGGYSYDGLRRRVVKKTYVGGVLSETRDVFHSRRWQTLEERLDIATIDRQFVWGKRFTDDLVLRDRTSLFERLYAVQDSNWNVVCLVSSDSSLCERNEYDAYGAVVFMSPSYATRQASIADWEHLGNGRRRDPESALDYTWGRYRHSALGCWVSRDPIKYVAGDVNLSRDVFNNPVNTTDSSGLELDITNPDVRKALGEAVEKYYKDHPAEIEKLEDTYGPAGALLLVFAMVKANAEQAGSVGGLAGLLGLPKSAFELIAQGVLEQTASGVAPIVNITIPKADEGCSGSCFSLVNSTVTECNFTSYTLSAGCSNGLALASGSVVEQMPFVPRLERQSDRSRHSIRMIARKGVLVLTRRRTMENDFGLLLQIPTSHSILLGSRSISARIARSM